MRIFDGENIRGTDWLNEMIRVAIRRNVSDIHLEPTEKDLRVRFRLHGRLWDVLRTEKSRAESATIRIKAISHMDIAEKRLPQDGGYRFRDGDRYYDLRIATVPVIYGEKIVIRILGNSLREATLEQLGMTDKQIELFRHFLHRSHGLIISAGATGTGKSTTLHAALRELNSEASNLVAVEDPTEYRIEGVNQISVDEKTGLTFSTALRSVLRSDPDIIMIGEIRDKETAEIAVRAALTGHLVLSTLHANRATEVPLRFLEMGVEPYLVSASLRLVMSQRLVRLLCPECKKHCFELPEPLMIAGEKDAQYCEAAGCEQCDNTGYIARTGVFELLPLDAKKIESLTDRKSMNLAAEKQLYISDLQDAIRVHMRNGDIDWREGLRLCEEASI